MALRRNIPAYQELDKLVMEGRAQLVATPTADTGTLPTIVATQAKEVAIITRICSTLAPTNSTATSPTDQGAGHSFALYDENGDLTGEKMYFLSHQLYDQAFYGSVTADSSPFTQSALYRWTSAPPNAPLIWDLEQPIVVPPRHTLRSVQDGPTAMAGGNFVCRGYITDEETARMLGFSTGTQDSTYKIVNVGAITAAATPKNLTGFGGGFIFDPSFPGTYAGYSTIVPSLSGYSIQLLDLNVRLQPLEPGSTTRKATLVCSETEATAVTEFAAATHTPLCVVANNNPSQMANLQISPCIYLPPGKGLFLIGDKDVAIRATAAATYRYVKNEDVPEGSWWSYAAITPPGANTNTVGTNSLYTDGSTTFTVYYAGKEAKSRSVTTATTAGTGFQHVVEGYAISGQKDNTVSSDRAYLALTAGTADGNIGLSGSGLTTTNYLITQIMCLGAHNQNLLIAEDGLNVPVPKDTGAVRLEITGRGAASSTPATNDLNVDELHCLVWGRTIPSNYGTGHFKGGAS